MGRAPSGMPNFQPGAGAPGAGPAGAGAGPKGTATGGAEDVE